MQMMTEIGELITAVGFPVFVAIYVLMRLEPAIQSLKKTVNVLTYVMAKSQGVDYEEAKKIAGDCK